MRDSYSHCHSRHSHSRSGQSRSWAINPRESYLWLLAKRLTISNGQSSRQQTRVPRYGLALPDCWTRTELYPTEPNPDKAPDVIDIANCDIFLSIHFANQPRLLTFRWSRFGNKNTLHACALRQAVGVRGRRGWAGSALANWLEVVDLVQVECTAQSICSMRDAPQSEPETESRPREIWANCIRRH